MSPSELLGQAQELAETLRVKWFMMDAQQKQVILLATLYLGYTLLDVGGAVLKAKLNGGQA